MDREAGKSGSLNIFTSLGVIFSASKKRQETERAKIMGGREGDDKKGRETERFKASLSVSSEFELMFYLNLLSSLTRIRHDHPGLQCVPLEADSLVDKVWEAQPPFFAQIGFCNRTFSPSLNLLHGGSAWDFNHSLHSR